MEALQGVYLPIITPFHHDELDLESYQNMVRYYIGKGISGLIPMGTTGESHAVTEVEFEKIIECTLEITNKSIPVYIGVGGNITAKVIEKIKKLEPYPIDGILSVCPYYNRPGQRGLFEHFLKLSETTDLNIIIYNIPYRTGVNLKNETLLRLAEMANIIGVKDSCGDIKQTLELIFNKPNGFSVLTGEDILFYTTAVNGGDGGILAASHLGTEVFLRTFELIKENNHQAALNEWHRVSGLVPMLFEETNPGPIKHCLSQLNLIRSSETRLPITGVSKGLAERLDHALQLFTD
jgi:4-hydroxy-tetrahydrodipicolinate synthase